VLGKVIDGAIVGLIIIGIWHVIVLVVNQHAVTRDILRRLAILEKEAKNSARKL
jgi:hypothetical protein